MLFFSGGLQKGFYNFKFIWDVAIIHCFAYL